MEFTNIFNRATIPIPTSVNAAAKQTINTVTGSGTAGFGWINTQSVVRHVTQARRHSRPLHVLVPSGVTSASPRTFFMTQSSVGGFSVNMKAKFALLAASAGLLVTSLPVLAHHSFAAEYDEKKPINLKGTVSKVEWTNPHARFYVDVKDDAGKVTTWNFELASPNVLIRNGWTRKSLKEGDMVTVMGSQAKDGAYLANARSVVLADGRKVFAGQRRRPRSVDPVKPGEFPCAYFTPRLPRPSGSHPPGRKPLLSGSERERSHSHHFARWRWRSAPRSSDSQRTHASPGRWQARFVGRLERRRSSRRSRPGPRQRGNHPLASRSRSP